MWNFWSSQRLSARAVTYAVLWLYFTMQRLDGRIWPFKIDDIVLAMFVDVDVDVDEVRVCRE
jgi:hypothetical protein